METYKSKTEMMTVINYNNKSLKIRPS